MKRMFCLLLAALCFALPALAQSTPPSVSFGPYVLTAPQGVTVEEGEGSRTFVAGVTRVVAIVIERVPDADPEEAILRMMRQFDPATVIGETLPLAEGYVGVRALTPDKLGPDVDQLTVMVLSGQGHLLILSGYDMLGDEAAVQALLDALLETLAAQGRPLVLTKESSAPADK